MYYDYEIYNMKEKQTFRPSLIPRQLPDVVEIIGPRSIGMTTTVNIISIGMYDEKCQRNQLLGRK